MIYTVTLNPSLDYITRLEEFQQGVLNRTASEQILPGGKGINVSLVLKNLGIDSVALGMIAGFSGQEVEARVQCAGVKTDFIRLQDGFTRINVKVMAQNKTELNGSGPCVTTLEIEKLYQKIDELKDGDVLVLAGSVPGTLPENIYEHILDRICEKKVETIVDATGKHLWAALNYHPFLVKPNQHELGELFDTVISSKEVAAAYAGKLQHMGARNVLVSMGGKGAILLTEDGKLLKSDAPQGEVVNAVGAGDSMVAGFLAGLYGMGCGQTTPILGTEISKEEWERALDLGIAAGSASAFSEDLATRNDVEYYYTQAVLPLANPVR